MCLRAEDSWVYEGYCLPAENYLSGIGIYVSSRAVTDMEFASTLCGYVIDNASSFYKGQPSCREGWENRYLNEMNDCLEMLDRHCWKYMLEGDYYANGWLNIGSDGK